MDIKGVDLNLLVTFEGLLRYRSVSRVATAMGMSQPAASYALKRLRAMLEDPLFVRTPRGIDPTPRAEALGVVVQDVLDQIRTGLLASPRFDPSAARRTMTLDMVDVGELVFLPRVVETLRVQAPGIVVRAVSNVTSALPEQLRSGEVDLALGRFSDLENASLFRQRLFSHSFACIVREDRNDIGDRILRGQYENALHVAVESDSDTNTILEQALAGQGLSRRVVLKIPHHLALPAVVIENDLIATVPYAVGVAFARMSSVKVVRPPVRLPVVDVYQWWHARFNHDPYNRWVRELIGQLFMDPAKPSNGRRRAGRFNRQ